MLESAWRYLKDVWNQYPDVDPAQVAKVVWSDAETACLEMLEAHAEIRLATTDSFVYRNLDEEVSSYPGALSLMFDLDSMMNFMADGCRAFEPEAMELLDGWRSQLNPRLKVDATMIWAQLAARHRDKLPLLVAELANSEDADDRCPARGVIAQLLGKIDPPSDAMVAVLAEVAGNMSEAQPLRSFCLEALMNLGPSAGAAIPVLEEVFSDPREDYDLQQFAWAALKSVQAPGKHHPCGGTVAEHLQGLYRVVKNSDLSGPDGNE
jgi:hypothetical protein